MEASLGPLATAGQAPAGPVFQSSTGLGVPCGIPTRRHGYFTPAGRRPVFSSFEWQCLHEPCDISRLSSTPSGLPVPHSILARSSFSSTASDSQTMAGGLSPTMQARMTARTRSLELLIRRVGDISAPH
jgi:hypothetical protein